MRTAVDIRVTGTVQGVGFRPFVYGLAAGCSLAGRVSNAGDGVRIHVEGEEAALGRFIEMLREEAPAAARIASVEVAASVDEGCRGFEIASSDADAGGRTHVSPDLATCPRCLAELLDPSDRRYRYPFINCTNCGPRFTVIEGLPYDRPRTSMSEFEMCPACAAEYADPSDRRFHAQPDACFACGPVLTFAWAEEVAGDGGGRGSSGFDLPFGPSVRPRPFGLQSPDSGFLKRARTGRLRSYVFAGDDGGPDDSGREGRGGFCGPFRPTKDGDLRASGGREAIEGRHEGSARDAWSDGVEARREASDAALAAAADVVDRGGIVAVKGLGGYHLMCDACNEDAVRRLRGRKHRPDKPLAIMVDGIDMARRFCIVDGDEASLLSSPAAPVVLLRRIATAGGRGCGAPARLASGIADGLAEVGVMLPATPVQHLLVRALRRPLVMTSGNASEEPIAIGGVEAHERLSGIADAFLDNDRRITARYDDSVARVVGGRTMLVRRARGYAPSPIAFPDFGDVPPILGTGPELKATFALADGMDAFVSQHIGDMRDADAFGAWEDALASYRRLFGIEPQAIAHDLHPGYLTTQWARARVREGAAKGACWDGPVPTLVAVQHHHAHIASVIGEHLAAGELTGPTENVIGVALDGTGMGDDGAVWGGEVLVCNAASYRRIAHFPSFLLLGGDQATRNPLRLAFALLRSCGLEGHPAARRALSTLGDEALSVLGRMAERRVNSVETTSAGRLFDAVSALLGVCREPTYDGQPAMMLEAAMGMPDAALRRSQDADSRYRFGLKEDAGGLVALDASGPLGKILDDMEDGVAIPTIAQAFHRAVADAIVALCLRARASTGIATAALSGGVFSNRYLAHRLPEALQAEGFRVLLNIELPPNDGCISYGQAVVAAARLAHPA